MRGLFLNTKEPVCGVHAYGKNLYSVLEGSTRFTWDYCEPETEDEIKFMAEALGTDVYLVNYQGLIGGVLAGAPFLWMKKKVLVYHDCDIDESRWDAIVFSDPGMKSHRHWFSIGRPLPQFKTVVPELLYTRPVIGVHGFLGAWADNVVRRVMQEYEYATIRLQLPYSKFCDPSGDQARSMADRCRQMVNNSGITLDISHDFLPQQRLLEWLAQNDLNCYIRPTEMIWRGVSSAPDCTMAVRKPIAVNKSSAFRHLHGLFPMITVEDMSLGEIIRNGLSPLVPLYTAWHPDVVRRQVEDVLLSL